MNTKVALLIVYNHRFDGNIPRLNSLYAGHFSHVYHLVPFYDGGVPNVIPVYGNSYYFQTYVSQAYTHLKNKGFTHFFVVADDLILNPAINERNLWEITGLAHNECFMPYFTPMNEGGKKWFWLANAIRYRLKQKGLEISQILPTREEAYKAMRSRKLEAEPLRRATFRHLIWTKRHWKEGFWSNLRLVFRKSVELDYPMVHSYSDIYLITAEHMERFCTWCGAFAAGGLFVEIATPTALALTAAPVKNQRHLKLKGGARWGADIEKLSSLYKRNLHTLLENFPADTLYLHPIKLSKWM